MPLIVVRRASSSVVWLVVLAHLHLAAMRLSKAAWGRQVASDEGDEIDQGNDGETPRPVHHIFLHRRVGGDKSSEAERGAGDGEEAEADKAEDRPALGLLHEVHGS